MACIGLFALIVMLHPLFSSAVPAGGKIVFEEDDENEFFPNPEEDNPLPPTHEIVPRTIFRIRSKGPLKDDEYQYGIGLKGHFVNLLQGGTVGVDFRIPHYHFPGIHPHRHDDTSETNKDDNNEVESEDENTEKGKREGRDIDYDVIDPRIRH